MGVIKDGMVSGTLPSNLAFAIHYPAYPSSMSRAIETLGGLDKIVKSRAVETLGGHDKTVKARSLESNKLELHFRPEDPYSHPAFGEPFSCKNFLLKISKKKSSDRRLEDGEQKVSQSASESVICPEESEGQRLDDVNIEISADIVDRVSEAYHFNGMADYQHVLAVHADVARKKKRTWEDVDPHFEKGGFMDVDQEDLMILVPPLFSPKDKPQTLVLRQTSSVKKKQEEIVQHRPEMNIESDYFMNFDDEEIPNKTNWEKYVVQESDQWEWLTTLSKMFEERPIWHKNSVVERLRDNGVELAWQAIKRLLLRIAYYFTNGPFLRLWIRKGYDPRKDPDSRIYQIIDFRVPLALQSYCDANKGNELNQKWKDICAFQVFPYKFHTTLQFFELVDDYIQQEIRKPSKQQSCTRVSGWFSGPVSENLRLRVLMNFLSVYPETGAESLLKSTSTSFEKSKKMLIYEQSRPDQGGKKEQVNKEMDSGKDTEKSQDIPDENENVDPDDEEEEDVHMDDDDDDDIDDFPLQQSSYIDGDNISRNYLQELFGSFRPILARDNNIPDADVSDEEYQIYEHNSDNNSGDDGY